MKTIYFPFALDIPKFLEETEYPEFKGLSLKDIIKGYKAKKLSLKEINKYGKFLVDIEKQRAVERDFIFEHAKILTFGFKL